MIYNVTYNVYNVLYNNNTLYTVGCLMEIIVFYKYLCSVVILFLDFIMAGNKKFHLSTLTIDFMRVLLVRNALKTLVKQRGLIFRTGRGNDSR